MDFLARLGPPEIVNGVLGLLAGVASTWLVLSLVHLVRLRRAVGEAGAIALAGSRRVLKGQAAEQLAPLAVEFSYLPSDARFLGSPIDYLVFDGLSDDDEPVEIVFLEVKTGRARLTAREARIREAVQAGRVRWEELRL